MNGTNDDSVLIDALGGTVATAALCEVRPQAVSQWRRGGIPKARLMYLRLLRPELIGAAVDPVDALPTEPERDAA